jgi:tetratricopeptide (TPR) repeat protein
MDGRDRRVSVEFFQWLMAPAVIFLMFSILTGTRWRGVRAAILLGGLFLVPTRAPASDASNAKEALTSKRYEEARDAYHKLAGAEKSGETRARYRLGEATAAYRAGDFRQARTAFSGALLSRDPQVEAGGHRGIGNSLFQLGWKGLTGENYPTDPGSLPDLDHFDELVKKELANLRDSEVPEEGDSGGFSKFETLITNWTDAVRHHDSALKLEPADKVARRNRELTMIYLKRLQELLVQEEQEAQQSMPQQQPGEGAPQEGEDGEGGEGNQAQEGENGSKRKPGKGGDQKDPKDGSGKQGDQKKDGQKGKDKDQKKKGDSGDNPNESPEERSRRILKENADLEKGPLTPGRREFRDAAQDW